MSNIQDILKKVRQNLKTNQRFFKAAKGTKSTVYLSKDYAVKINKDHQALLGEGRVLKSLDLPFVPKALDLMKVENFGVLVEEKFPGKPLDNIWKALNDKNKERIIKDLVEAIKRIHGVKKNKFWLARYPNKNFNSYAELLVYKLERARKKIVKSKKALKIYQPLNKILTLKNFKTAFAAVQPAVIHGDLIMHNLLTDGKKLTGILDWEFAQYGDPFYDLARVIYYQECAKAYEEKGKDEVFEYDFTSRMIKGLKSAVEYNENKYRIIRSLYFAESIAWAVFSENPEKNLAELQMPWFY